MKYGSLGVLGARHVTLLVLVIEVDYVFQRPLCFGVKTHITDLFYI